MTLYYVHLALYLIGLVSSVVFLILFLPGLKRAWDTQHTAVASLILTGLCAAVALVMGRSSVLYLANPMPVDRAVVEEIFSLVALVLVDLIMVGLLYLYYLVKRRNGNEHHSETVEF